MVDITGLYRQVASGISTALNNVDIDLYTDRQQKKTISTLKQLAIDVRLDIRAIDMADSRDELVKNSQQAQKGLEQLRKTILAASEFNVFNPVDVAQLTATIEQISANLVEK